MGILFAVLIANLIAAFVFVLIIYFVPHLMFKFINNRNIYDDSDLVVHQINETYVMRPQVEEELNIVPFEDAMAIGTTDEKRSLLLDVLKRDMLKSSKIAHSALDDKDSETSHYAAAATMEIYRKLKISVNELELEFLSDKTNADVRRRFLDALYEYISSDVLTKRDYLISANKFVQLFNETRNTNDELLQCKDYMHQADFLMELNNPYNAEVIAKKAKQLFYNEDVYLKLMDIYFRIKNKPEFFKVFDELKKANISLSNHGLETIRFWIARGD